jgi:hypothetical protein
MLIHRGKPAYPVTDERMLAYFERHLAKADAWLKQRPDTRVLYVSYNEVLEQPADWADRVNAFLGGTLDSAAMTAVVDEQLYRRRG